MKELEKREIEIELKAVDYAQEKGILLKKCSIPGERNWPDRQAFCPNGHVFFIEFKRPGEEPRRGQIQNHKLLHRLGFLVYVCDNMDDAKRIIDWELKVATNSIHASRIPEDCHRLRSPK